MIHVKFEYDDEQIRLKVNGHAEQAVYGQDIICAAASVLTKTLAQCLKWYGDNGLLRSAPRLKLKGGDANIMCRPKATEFVRVMYDFLFAQTGFVLLAHNYPQYVMVETFETSTEDGKTISAREG